MELIVLKNNKTRGKYEICLCVEGGDVWGAETGPKTLPKKSAAEVGDIQTWPDCVYLGGNKDGATALGKAVIPQGRAPNRAGAALRCLPFAACPAWPCFCVCLLPRRGQKGAGGGTKAGRSREGGEPI